MKPGESCLACHNVNSPTAAPAWTMAGTVYASSDADPCEGVSGIRIVVMDSTGVESFSVTSNDAGNFYSAVPLPKEFRVAVEFGERRIQMPGSPSNGSCNTCHSDPPFNGASGRVVLPM